MVRKYFTRLFLLLILLQRSSSVIHAQTTTFNYTGSVQSYTVAPGVTSLGIDAKGGCGGGAYVSSGSSGPVALGGRITCTLTVTPGDVLNVYVGGGAMLISGGSNNPGGYNGGGQGCTYANAGGGSSDIRLNGTALANRVVVAGGGGGGGDFGPAGGLGGGLTGGSGLLSGSSPGGACGGGQSGPACTTGNSLGTLGQGSPLSTTGYSMGGGGGGYWGGNQGTNSNGSGGGGSSYANSTICANITHTQGFSGANGNGQIIITQLCTNPAPNTGGATSVCSGQTLTFANVGTTGTWSTSNTSIATVAPTTGVVTGVAAGVVNVSYIIPGGCYASSTVTVNTGATVASISNNGPICSNVGLPLNLTTTGPANVSTYSWSGPGTITGATTGAASVASATPANTGIYSLTLTSTAGCVSVYTTSATVNLGPTAIPGTGNACLGSNTTLTNTISGGTWTSSISGVASVNASTGVLTPVSLGTTNVSYTLSSGCAVGKAITVNATPSLSVSPGTSQTICLNSGAAFTASASGATFTWSGTASEISCASCGSTTITPTAVDINNYSVTATNPSGCSSTSAIIVSVNPVPAPISGLTNICVGTTTGLSSSAGGTWSSSDVSKASIGLSTGVITGLAIGTSTISYNLPTGCRSTVVANISAAPAGISGNASVCLGLVTNLSHSVAGGTWTSSAAGIAAVNAAGSVTGLAAGNATITYTLPSGCTTTLPVVVNPLPAAIAGTTAVCQGLTSNLSDADGGGTWSSNAPGIASVNAFGVLSGNATGNAIITYTLPTTCIATVPVTVNVTPAAITGIASMCIATQTSLSNATPGGNWTSNNGSIATVNSLGTVTGIAAGNTIITYSLSTGCKSTQAVTVNAQPAAITGNTEFCQNATSLLSNANSGGTWASSNTAVATINTAGTATGVSAGNATITYTLPTGCKTTTTVMVDPLPGAITGNLNVCAGGGTTTLSNSSTDGSWSTASTAASVNASGVVTGISAGFASVVYTLSTGCSRAATVVVNPQPAAISGSNNVCIGATTTFSDATINGTWSSSNYSIASVDVAGVVTGVASGNAAVTYTLPTGCSVTKAIQVNTLPATITGTATVCAGLTTALHSATTGGTWSADNAAIASVNATGVVTGQAQGEGMITYTLATGCYRTRNVTVNPTPAAIGGVMAICNGLTASLSSATAGGVWTSSTPAIATVDAGGTVTAIATGNSNITYTLPEGCRTMAQVTVNALPANITGNTTVCQGLNTTLSSASAGGNWSNSGSGITSINATTGQVTGQAAGMEMITYTLPTGCIKTTNVMVNQLPATIAGNLFVCAGLTTTLSNSSAGGTWSSSNTSAATVNAAGVVTGVAAGNSNIKYTLATGCSTTSNVVVNALPAAITGNATVCPGTTTTLANASTGGTWSSSNGNVMVNNAGVVSGMSTGTAIVTYTIATGCTSSKTVTVNALPAAIAGASGVCQGSSTGLSNPTSGGTWSSSAATTASVNSAGVITGLNQGNVVISYTLPTGCYSTAAIVVNATPATITGTARVCPGTTTTLDNTTPGGVWGTSSDNASITLSGEVTGTTAGNAVISYVLSSGCIRTRVVTVNPLPAAITGTAGVCPGSSVTLANATTGGTWSTNQPLTATTNASGAVTGVATGNTTVTYTLSTGCYATKAITVYPGVQAISGTSTICSGTSANLSTASTGGLWISNNTTIATVGAISGTVTGNNEGAVVMTYTLPTGCMATYAMSINAAPSAILGASATCIGTATTLTNSVSGGGWTSSDPATVSVNSLGVANGVAPGMAMITYTLPSGCSSSATFMVNDLPAINTVSGGGSYCAGGAGVGIHTDGSTLGTTYTLTRGSATAATVTGAGGPIDFGAFTAAGTYSMSATSAAGCSRNMSGSATVSITPVAIPSVTINSAMGDSLCSGTAATYTAVPNNGGSTPAYEWKVNGVTMGSSATYSYTPANGDIVTVALTSNAICASPATATNAIAMTVIPTLTPAVSIAAAPGNSICKGTAVTFTATGANGGTAPVYTWFKNGALYTEGATFTYTPENGDVIMSKLNSNYRCPSANNVSSSNIAMTVNNVYVPVVAITANPGTSIAKGQTVTFTTTVSNAGPTPHYQWLVNGIPVGGANAATFSGNRFNEGDSVTCSVMGSGDCGMETINSVVMHVTTTGVAHTAADTDIRLVPNPNNGSFAITGTIGSVSNEAVMVTVTDMLGQVVYRGNITATAGSINERINLGSNLANGMYLLNLHSDTMQQVFSFIVKQ